MNADEMFSAVYSFEISRVNTDGGWGDINPLVPFSVCIGFALLLLLRVSRCSAAGQVSLWSWFCREFLESSSPDYFVAGLAY